MSREFPIGDASEPTAPVEQLRAALAAVHLALRSRRQQDNATRDFARRAVERLRDDLAARVATTPDATSGARLNEILQRVNAAVQHIGVDRFEQARIVLESIDPPELERLTSEQRARVYESPASDVAEVAPVAAVAGDGGAAYRSTFGGVPTTRIGPATPLRSAQVFHPVTNTLARASILGALVLLGVLALAGLRIADSPYTKNTDVYVTQPVPFSHQHHVKGLGIDCRYCHTSVEKSAFAGIPPTETCMSCHSQVWNQADMLAPVRASYTENTPIEWNRVHNMPDFVYFNHSAHVKKGVGCNTCHGPVHDMPLMRKAESMTMAWCLNCHFEPEKFLRPADQVFNTEYVTPPNQLELGQQLVKDYHINKEKLGDCAVCHR